MEKKKYYVSMVSSEISQIEFGNNNDFTIHATDDEIKQLRTKMDNMHNADTRAYWRAHVPIMPYSNDKSNDDYDSELTEAFEMIYNLGDYEAKENIDSMGVLTDRHI